MNTEQVERLTHYLDFMTREPCIPREKCMAEGIPAYFTGFSLGLRVALGIDTDPDAEKELRRRAASIRGWDIHEHPYTQMVRKGLSSDQAVAELAAIEIEFIRLALTR